MNFTLKRMKPYSARVALYVFLVVMSVLFTMATALSVADFSVPIATWRYRR